MTMWREIAITRVAFLLVSRQNLNGPETVKTYLRCKSVLFLKMISIVQGLIQLNFYSQNRNGSGADDNANLAFAQ